MLNCDLVGVVDGTSGIDNLDCDGGSGVDVDHPEEASKRDKNASVLDSTCERERECCSPGVGRALLGGEVLESSGRWWATWNDGDVERSGSLTPTRRDEYHHCISIRV